MRPMVYVGFDAREALAYRVCCESLRKHSPDVLIQPISRSLLGGLYTRPTSKRGDVLWDDISNAPCTTDFSIARFHAPHLAQTGLIAFCDCDFLWRDAIEPLFEIGKANPDKAIHCVQHDYTPVEGVKMDRQPQTVYPRKNWSSMVLWNLDHPSNQPLVQSAHAANTLTGSQLHRFVWLEDEEIGELPLYWNWLEGVSQDLQDPIAVHFTRGVPSIPGYEDSKFADEWGAYARGAA